MQTKYILENQNEAYRLEDQSKLGHYSIHNELNKCILPNQGRVLDAGCGSGLVSNAIKMQNPALDVEGCDLSQQNIDFAKARYPHLKFFKENLLEISHRGEKYDCIINRYVAHHLSESHCLNILSEFKKSLNPQGKLIIIDIEGALLNLGTTDQFVKDCFIKIKNHFNGDIYIARKIPALLQQIGFKSIQYQISVMDFQGKDKKDEIEQIKQRFENSSEFYISALGNEVNFQKFKKIYLKEVASGVLFYNKFIIQACL